MKKILLLIDSLASGGAQRQIIGLSKLLQDKGHDVTLAHYYPDNFYKEWLAENNVKTEFLICKDSKWSKFVKVKKIIKEKKFETVIAYIDGPTVICCMLKILSGNFHLIVSERNVTQTLSKNERIKFLFYHFADYIVANSETQKQFINNHYKHLERKTLCITNFVDLDYFKPATNITKNDDLTNILIVGRISNQKNIIRFLRVVKKIKEDSLNVVFNWFGDYDPRSYGENLYNEASDYIKREALDNLFHLHKATSHILEQYQMCDVFCLPSLYEGFPNVICEAMSCGKPILCSDVCDNSNIVKEGENGLLFDPLDENSIYSTIKEFVEMSIEMKCKMGDKSREIALEKFGKDVFCEQYESII